MCNCDAMKRNANYLQGVRTSGKSCVTQRSTCNITQSALTLYYVCLRAHTIIGHTGKAIRRNMQFEGGNSAVAYSFALLLQCFSFVVVCFASAPGCFDRCPGHGLLAGGIGGVAASRDLPRIITGIRPQQQ